MSDQLDIKKLSGDRLIALLRLRSSPWRGHPALPLRVCACGAEVRGSNPFCRRCLEAELDRRINNRGTGE